MDFLAFDHSLIPIRGHLGAHLASIPRNGAMTIGLRVTVPVCAEERWIGDQGILPANGVKEALSVATYCSCLIICQFSNWITQNLLSQGLNGLDY